MTETQHVYAFAWYSKTEWQKLKRAVDDPDTLDDTYEDWRKSAEHSINEIRASGVTINKIAIKISELLEWCESEGVRPDGDSRANFAALKSQERDQRKG